ncbi:MAG: hypothetical protein CMI31_06395 [Opitutae bacterium]|nr:hypothetical protein [Opitutae bacterium]|tara:strand:+ start:1321 stop:2535 length:1215 start_codon:yes stop_codon:yes gene_type:complete
MKALVISTAAPDATSENQTGSTNWTLRLLRLLSYNHEITLLAPPPLDEPFLKQAAFSIIECPPDNHFGKCARFIKSLRWKIYPSMWHQRSSKIERSLAEATGDSFDVCWLLDDYAGMYLREVPRNLPIVFCRHFVLNMGLPVKSEERNLASIIKLGWHRRLATSFDRWTAKHSNITVVGTEESRGNLHSLAPDAKIIYFPTKPCYLPKPIAAKSILRSKRADKRIVAVFVGDMSFPRNEDAVDWLISKALPLLSEEEISHFHFKFIGRTNKEKMENKASAGNSSVEFTGFVDDLSSHLADAQCTVIPVFGGNGVRIKTVTLLGSGLPAVSTKDGIEGLPIKNGVDAIIANNPKSFAEGLRQMLDVNKRKSLAANCRIAMASFLSEDEDANEIMRISEQAIKANF